MKPRSTLPFWSILVLAAAAQCSGDVEPLPNSPAPTPPATPGPSTTPPPVAPPTQPPGSVDPPPAQPPAPPMPPVVQPPPAPMPPPPPATPPGMPGTPPPPAATPAGPPGPWARDVQIGLVEASQAVFIKLGDGQQTVAPAMRNAPLIEGRPMFVRVHATTQMGFTARRLRAVLSLDYGAQGKYEVEETRMVTGSSSAAMLASSFNFLIPAENVKPATKLSAFLYEAGAATGADPATLPKFPAGEALDLGVKAGRMELTIVIVPDANLMDTPAARKKVEQDVFDLYPVQKVNLKFHEPVPIMGAFSSQKGFTILRDLREKEMAKPWEYYHYITGAAGAGFAGVSSVANATPGAASRRTSITIVGQRKSLDGNTNTLAHETGHASGSSHMPGCGAAGPDMMFPYRMPAGDMGVNGYSLSFNAFKSRMMFRELMSYCRPRWISDYVYGKFEQRVRIVTGFESSPEAMAQMMANRSLLGYAGPGQAADWGVVAGQLVDSTATMTPTQYARLRLVDGREVMAPVAVNFLTDDATREFAINLDGADYSDGDVLQAEVVIDGQSSMVPVGSMYRR